MTGHQTLTSTTKLPDDGLSQRRDSIGLTLFLTGLPGAGKSTIARLLRGELLAAGRRAVTLLDGDEVRRTLSPDLGFSRAERDLHIRRLGFVAREVTRHGGAAICAAIAPYDGIRRELRREIAALGTFVLVHVDTPLAVCEARDPKGLYARARAGLVPALTGISDPYEAPTDAEVTVDTSRESPTQSAGHVLAWLVNEGYLPTR